MRIGLQVWGQHVEWTELMAAGPLIEGLGFDSLWSNDHFYPPFGAEDGPVFEGWMTLAGWVGLTERIRIGCLVSGAAYRNPALLVKMATALDHASRGRMVLGLGAGWHEREHRALGYALLRPRARIARLAEAAAIARGLLAGDAVTFAGAFWSVEDARNDPPTYQGRHMPLLIGGSGERFTLAVVARYADIWNGEGDPATVARKTAALYAHCAAVGRDPAEIEVTINLPPPCVRASRSEAIGALTATFRRHGLAADAALRSAEASPCIGPVPEVIASLERYAAVGVEEVIFDTPHPVDLETLAALGGPIRAHFAQAA